VLRRPVEIAAQRIPEIGDASVYRITVNDHYVQVFLSDGREEQLLMRFGDAISELKAIPGIVTHRSHWVAAAKVTKMIKVNGREFTVSVASAFKVPR
jgi:DNA-binding LytR/AlgR family response regulator